MKKVISLSHILLKVNILDCYYNNLTVFNSKIVCLIHIFGRFLPNLFDAF